jgi:hypothetical protein
MVTGRLFQLKQKLYVANHVAMTTAREEFAQETARRDEFCDTMRAEAMEARVVADRQCAQLANFASKHAAAARSNGEYRCATAAWVAWREHTVVSKCMKADLRRAALHYDAKAGVPRCTRKLRHMTTVAVLTHPT